jgi:hypothetical protein
MECQFLVELAFDTPGPHEWIGFGPCPIAILHVVLQWHWFTSQLRTILSLRATRSSVNLLLNTLLLAVAVGTTVSGILVSNQVVPSIGERLGKT